MKKATQTHQQPDTAPNLEMVVWCLQLMERQKERVDALLLAIKDQLDEGTFTYILADLAKSIQEDHKYWYELEDRLGIRERMRAEVSHG